MGVEEELLLVESGTGRALSLASQVLQQAAADASPDDAADVPFTGALEKELQRQQIETGTAPHADLAALGEDVRAWRRTAIDAARHSGAQIAALGTSPIPVEPRPTDNDRFREMAERFGITTAENLTCGCHVHVSIESREEAVAVIDRIRPWLPILIAVSANSPFWQGNDTSYASYRTQAQSRWPTTGPSEIFGSAEAYDDLVASMMATNTVLDSAMLYFDARVSQSYPTVELRVADVCLDPDDTVLVAGLARAMVMTAAAEWAAGKVAPPVPVAMLRLANWQASRAGLGENLLDPLTGRPRPADEVVHQLLDHVRPALRECGDEVAVTEALERVLAVGNGADRQRDTWERTGSLADVVADAVRVTAGQEAGGVRR
ncbi:carboxylate-amine ligase [Pseudactinotalea terrae]|uniref:carboxylate-amine ligase n=1 Tax=Pseudactinotalea terrae TaxID=1743262 RepID=UPI001883DD47|nr:glutamate--cysteine ligase [Pseudactinotalea terrae]